MSSQWAYSILQFSYWYVTRAKIEKFLFVIMSHRQKAGAQMVGPNGGKAYLCSQVTRLTPALAHLLTQLDGSSAGAQTLEVPPFYIM